MERKQPNNVQKNKTEPGGSRPKNAHVERKFNEIRDLLRLEFSFDGRETLTVYSATPEQMTMLAEMFANVSEVDTDVWPVSERLDFVNALWEFCQSKQYDFPLRIQQPVELSEQGNTSNLAYKFSSNF
jgi:hypothetical protein